MLTPNNTTTFATKLIQRNVLFEELNLNTPLRNAINDMGFVYPTPIQEQSFSTIMSGRDVIGIAQTGTGKTLAYLLPILRQLPYAQQKHPRVLILVPTRELVKQVVNELEKLSEYMNLRIAGVYGGANINKQAEVVFNGLDVLIGTPGRLFDLAMKGVLSLKSIKKLVIDEVDEMLNMGFRPQVVSLLELLPPKRQSILFSATLSEDVEALLNDFFLNPVKIEIAPHGTPLEKIQQIAYHVPNFHTKINLLEHILKETPDINKALIFAGSRKLADLVYETISDKLPNKIGVIHSNKSQNYRFNALSNFEDGLYQALIATDIMARGLDITDVSHVINLSLPENPGDYLHRIGRTGRADKDGIAISLISDFEIEKQDEIEDLMDQSMAMVTMPDSIAIAETLLPEEEPSISSKNYLKMPNLKGSQGAFHEKTDKNRKVNSGSPGKKKPKNKKPVNRSARKRKFKK